MAKVAYLFDPIFLEHNPGTGHPEHSGRLQAINTYLERKGMFHKVARPTFAAAERRQLQLVHHTEYINRVMAERGKDGVVLDIGDTRLSGASVDAALKAAGAAVAAVDLVFGQDFDKVFAAVRPPGHHARPASAMGFCIFNNIALAAAYALKQDSQRRILIIDWDLHHGNGTQEMFYASNKVFYLSLHQAPFFPLTGKADECGDGHGEGFTINIPLTAGTGDNEYLAAFEEALQHIEKKISPDLVLISTGFDAHSQDPIGGLLLSDDAFYKLTEISARFAQRHANGRIISFLEGGYNTAVLARNTYRHLQCLLKH